MTTELIRRFWVTLLISATGLCTVLAESFSIKGGRVGVDGIVSTGGVFSASGIIGQTDAGQASGGSFTIQGGIVAVVQTPGAPLLSITRTNSNVTVWWPTPADGWVLEQTNRLTGLPGPWPQVPFAYVTNATGIRVTVPVTPGNLFFRLYKP